MTKRISIGWIRFDPVNMKTVRPELGDSWWARKKPVTAYQSEAICTRYLAEGERAMEAFIEVEDDGNN